MEECIFDHITLNVDCQQKLTPQELLFSDQSISCDKKPEICEFNKMCENCAITVDNIKVIMPADIEQNLPSFLPDFVINVSKSNV